MEETGEFTELSGRHASKSLRNCSRQDHDTTHYCAGSLDHLEPQRQIVGHQQQGADLEKRSPAAENHKLFSGHFGRYHGLIPSTELPDSKEDECDKGSAEKSDDGRRVPIILVAAPNHRQEEHDTSRSKESKAYQVKFFGDNNLEFGFHWRFSHLFGNAEHRENADHETTER